MTYKEDLERSKSILDIQQSYERECQQRLLLLKKMFPDDFARIMLSEHLAIWLAAEKYAVEKFGISDRHWIQEKI